MVWFGLVDQKINILLSTIPNEKKRNQIKAELIISDCNQFLLQVRLPNQCCKEKVKVFTIQKLVDGACPHQTGFVPLAGMEIQFLVGKFVKNLFSLFVRGASWSVVLSQAWVNCVDCTNK